MKHLDILIHQHNQVVRSRLSVHFYTTSNGRRRASVVDNGRVLYLSAAEAKAYVADRPHIIGHQNNPTRPGA